MSSNVWGISGYEERLSSVEVVLIKNSKLKGEGKAPTLAQKLAREAIFGDDVMIRCTPFGTGTLNALPVKELQYLKDIMFQQLPQYWNNTVGFEDLWKSVWKLSNKVANV